jgi:epoxyqueuosine reductase
MSKVSQIESELEAAAFVRDCIANFVKTSPLNRMPDGSGGVIFDEPLVQFAGGDDPLFAEYKTIIHPSHMLPREALSKSRGKDADEISARLSVISWILPITAKAREANRLCKDSTPAGTERSSMMLCGNTW